jgi:hypothetical protein
VRATVAWLRANGPITVVRGRCRLDPVWASLCQGRPKAGQPPQEEKMNIEECSKKGGV